MKALTSRLTLILSFTSFLQLQSVSAAIAPQSCTSLYEHLVEVNANWLTIDKNANPYLLEEVCFENEAKRIQNHLVLVIDYLEKDQDQINERRTTLLKALHGYAEKGHFPLNTHHKKRTPYFVDLNNTHCAVGYMMKVNGDLSLIDQISENYNNYYIEDMPQLALSKWATSNGFTKEELKWIQPGYPPPLRQYYSLGSNGGANGAIHCMAKDENDEMLYIGGEFTEVDNQVANGIIAWDGSQWHDLSDGFDGTVNDIFVYEELVYAVGAFSFFGNDDIVNVAVWDGVEWTGLQVGDMKGYINTVIRVEGNLYVGGSFTNINGLEADNLARYNVTQQQWFTNAFVSDQDIPLGFGVNGEVLDFAEDENEKIHIVGSFTETAPSIASPSPIKQEVNKFCSWNSEDKTWDYSLNFEGENINTIYADQNSYQTTIFTGSSLADENVMYVKRGIEAWEEIESYSFEPIDNDGVLHEFVKFGGTVYALGGFTFSFTGIASSGIFSYNNNEFLGPVAIFDKPIYAGISFQGYLYFGGDFTSSGYAADENGNVGSISLNNLAYSNLSLFTKTSHPELQSNVQVRQSNSVLQVDWNDLDQPIQLNLISLEGKKIACLQLTVGSGFGETPINHLPEGIYLYHITDGTLQKTGKIYISR